MIDIKVSSGQSVDVSTQGTTQGIQIQNQSLPRQEITVSLAKTQSVDILNANPYQKVEVVTPWTTRAELSELRIAIAEKVPKALSLLPPIESEILDTEEGRGECKIYIDAGGTPSFATVEQIKGLNTKTIFVDELTDEKILTLSNEDIILLRKE